MKSTDININISVPDDMDFNDPSSSVDIKVVLTHDDCGDKALDEFADGFAHLLYNVIQEFSPRAKDSKEQSGDENEESAGCI